MADVENTNSSEYVKNEDSNTLMLSEKTKFKTKKLIITMMQKNTI